MVAAADNISVPADGSYYHQDATEAVIADFNDVLDEVDASESPRLTNQEAPSSQEDTNAVAEEQQRLVAEAAGIADDQLRLEEQALEAEALRKRLQSEAEAEKVILEKEAQEAVEAEQVRLEEEAERARMGDEVREIAE